MNGCGSRYCVCLSIKVYGTRLKALKRREDDGILSLSMTHSLTTMGAVDPCDEFTGTCLQEELQRAKITDTFNQGERESGR